MRRSATIASFLAVVGAWIVVFTPAVLTLSLRMREIDPQNFLDAYPAALTAGWLTLMASLVAVGWIGDRLTQHLGSRPTIARWGVFLLAFCGLGLAFAPTNQLVTLAWILLQVPAAMVISSALALGGRTAATHNGGLISGLLGAASILALLAGSLLVTLFNENLTIGMTVSSLLGAALAIPLMFVPNNTVTLTPTHGEPIPGKTFHYLKVFWVIFLMSSFLLSWGTSTANGFIVALLENLSRIEYEDIALVSALAIALASMSAVAASIMSGVYARSPKMAVLVWVAGAILTATSIASLLQGPTGTVLYLVAVALGTGFGMSNGVEVILVLKLKPQLQSVGGNLSVFTAVTTVPYVLVPATAALLLRQNTRAGLENLFGLAAINVALGALLLAVFLLVVRLPSAESHHRPR